MAFIPELKPLMETTDTILTEIFYENRFTTVDDAFHDGEHIHDFYEIYVNLTGNVSFLVEDNVYPVKRGDIIMSAPDQIHRCLYHGDATHEHFCIWIKDFSFAPKTVIQQMRSTHKVELSEENKNKLIEFCFNLYGSHGDHSLPFRAAQNFFGILDIISTGAKKGRTEVQHLPPAFSEIVNYISRRFTEPACTPAKICENFYISKSTLCRRFRRYFQTTPSDYIESKRLSEAKQLLSTGHSVQSACINSGFSDCAYFIMRFRKKFGITPYKYQKEHIIGFGETERG